MISPSRRAGAETPVIGVIPGKIITERLSLKLAKPDAADLDQDVVKVAVIERHGRNNGMATGFVHGFGMKRGAIASSVGHDSHNLCVVGADEASMAAARQPPRRPRRRLLRGGRRPGDGRDRAAHRRADERHEL